MLNSLYLFYAFVFGAIFASFSSAIAWRTGLHPHKKDSKDKKYSVIQGRSMCPHCEKTLPWWALVPVLSYILLGGKCFNCKKNISIAYPIMEIACGMFMVLLVNQFLSNFINFYQLIIITFVFFVLIILSFQDIWFKEISDRIALPSIAIVFFLQLGYGLLQGNLDYVTSFLILDIILILIFGAVIIFTGSMGGGDLRVFILMGLILTFPQILFALTVAFVLASIVGIIGGLKEKKIDIIKYHVRLIPYLAIGFVLVIIWGNIITSFIYK